MTNDIIITSYFLVEIVLSTGDKEHIVIEKDKGKSLEKTVAEYKETISSFISRNVDILILTDYQNNSYYIKPQFVSYVIVYQNIPEYLRDLFPKYS